MAALRRSARNVEPAAKETESVDPPKDSEAGDPPLQPKSTRVRVARVAKCVRGERYKVAGDQFDADSDDDDEHPDFFFGVVTQVQKTGCKMMFDTDPDHVRYDGHLEAWDEFRIAPDDCTVSEEEIFQEVEVRAGLRKAPKPATPRKRHQRLDSSSDEGDTQSEDEAPAVVETWESDQEDDECGEEPDLAEGDDVTDDTIEAQYARAQWTNVRNLSTDPRAATGAMPENITPLFLMPSYRDESLLSWFLYYIPLHMIAEITKATNDKAKDIAWPKGGAWKHLRAGEFLRWLGLWILMTIYPVGHGGRRSYWRGMLNFQRYMPEKRFEQIIRAFTLPQYKMLNPERGGEAREFYMSIKFDKFQEVSCSPTEHGRTFRML